MSGECDKCHEHTTECKCHWSETEKGKQKLLDIINETFWFQADGNAVRKDEFKPLEGMNNE